MSYFNIGGNAGYALGAFVTGQLVVGSVSSEACLAMVPVLAAAFALTRVVPRLSRLTPERRLRARRVATIGAARWRSSAS